MFGTANRRTSTGFFKTQPCLVTGILVTSGVDAVDVSFYDTDDLTKTPIASATYLGRLKLSSDSSESFFHSLRCNKGLYMVVTAGTTPDVFAYIR